MPKKVILNIAGGVMSSIFSVGVLSELEKADVYDRIEAVYAGSAGVVVAAYFLTRQMSETKKIYSQDLSRTLYNPQNIPKLVSTAIVSRFWRRIPPEQFPQVVNLDAVYELFTKDYPLDVDALKSQPIPLYASFLNIDTGEVDYLDVRAGDVLRNIMVSINAVPGCYKEMKLNGKRYIDGAVKEPFSVRAVRRRHPDQPVLMVANENIARPLANRIKGVLEGLIAEWMLGVPVYEMYAKRERIITADFRVMERDKNMRLVNLPIGDTAKRYTTDPKRLEEFFDQGAAKGREAVKYIRGEV